MNATSSRFRICQPKSSAGFDTESSESILLDQHSGEAKLDIYREYTVDDLGLSPGLTKATWLRKMIEDELEEVNQGNMHLATISLNDHLASLMV
ncbi:MAG: hypothetical protein K0R08_1423 [Solimicrobium sp.]|jgi:hypothetical protein|nr:hypothetical protein [Solimicrobium sp.]